MSRVMSHTIYNFNPGPATLPKEVLQQAHNEFFNWHGLGMSVMEVSHRGSDFMAMTAEIESDLRELMNLPANYQVLFLAGGARGQFAAMPLNLAAENRSVAYVNTGLWGKIASQEAQRYAEVNIISDNSDSHGARIPEPNTWKDFSNAAYLHYTDNETVQGIEFPYVPDSQGVPLCCDMSSSILSRPLDISRFGLIYAGAQKNLGIAGITVVIIRDDLLQRVPQPITPSIINYSLQAKNKSLYNTPATYPWYICGLVLKWLKKQGGIKAIGEMNQRKADKLYRCIEQNDLYQNPIEPRFRSRMNVVFTLTDPNLEDLFYKKSLEVGLYGLKGHKEVGGFRASIYNAMPESGVDALVDFMKEFAQNHG